MSLNEFLLDNDELNGVKNEADDWQVNNFQIIDKIWHFWRFLSTLLAHFIPFWQLMKPGRALFCNIWQFLGKLLSWH
jgi:hypothetical protein